MLPKGHDRVAAILLRLKDAKPKDRDDEEEDKASDEDYPEGDDRSAGMAAAMADFRRALKAEDDEAMAEALCDLIHIHEGCEGPEDEDE